MKLGSQQTWTPPSPFSTICEIRQAENPSVSYTRENGDRQSNRHNPCVRQAISTNLLAFRAFCHSPAPFLDESVLIAETSPVIGSEPIRARFVFRAALSFGWGRRGLLFRQSVPRLGAGPWPVGCLWLPDRWRAVCPRRARKWGTEFRGFPEGIGRKRVAFAVSPLSDRNESEFGSERIRNWLGNDGDFGYRRFCVEPTRKAGLGSGGQDGQLGSALETVRNWL